MLSFVLQMYGNNSQNALFYVFLTCQNALFYMFCPMQNALFYKFSVFQNALFYKFCPMQNALFYKNALRQRIVIDVSRSGANRSAATLWMSAAVTASRRAKRASMSFSVP